MFETLKFWSHLTAAVVGDMAVELYEKLGFCWHKWGAAKPSIKVVSFMDHAGQGSRHTTYRMSRQCCKCQEWTHKPLSWLGQGSVAKQPWKRS